MLVPNTSLPSRSRIKKPTVIEGSDDADVESDANLHRGVGAQRAHRAALRVDEVHRLDRGPPVARADRSTRSRTRLLLADFVLRFATRDDRVVVVEHAIRRVVLDHLAVIEQDGPVAERFHRAWDRGTPAAWSSPGP